MAIGIPDLIAADGRSPLCPRDFDRRAAHATFTSLSNEVVALFPGSISEVRHDSAFHGQIGVEVRPALAIVRVSNFGKLITLFPFVGSLPDDAILQLKDLFVRYGYAYVEPAVLQSSYGGLCEGGFETWLDRFFGSK